jgi:hypothetical protein
MMRDKKVAYNWYGPAQKIGLGKESNRLTKTFFINQFHFFLSFIPDRLYNLLGLKNTW